MIINFFGIQLQIIDNGDGTFDVKPLDAVADKQAIRDELQRIRALKDGEVAKIDAAKTERDWAIGRRDAEVVKLNAAQDARDALVITIAELKAFLEAAGDVDA